MFRVGSVLRAGWACLAMCESDCAWRGGEKWRFVLPIPIIVSPRVCFGLSRAIQGRANLRQVRLRGACLHLKLIGFALSRLSTRSGEGSVIVSVVVSVVVSVRVSCGWIAKLGRGVIDRWTSKSCMQMNQAESSVQICTSQQTCYPSVYRVELRVGGGRSIW